MQNYLIRLEFIGGIIFNLKTFDRIEISKSEAIYLKALEYTGSKALAEKLLKKLTASNINSIDVDKFRKVIEDKLKNNKKLKFEIALKILEEKISKVYNTYNLSAPLEVAIYPSMTCNLNCKFCFVNYKDYDSSSLKNAYYWNSLISIFKSMDVVSLSILGGEPTIYKDIDLVLKHIENIGIITTITTNGVNIKQSTYDLILNSKYITPVFSIQSLNDLHKNLTGISYKVPISNIHRFIKDGKKVRINSVYTEQSVSDFKEIIDFCVENKIDRYSIGYYFENNKNNKINSKKNLLDLRILEDELQEYISTIQNGEQLRFSIEGCMLYTAYPEIEKEMVYLTEFDKKYYGCRAGKSKIEIYQDGRALPCILFENIDLNYKKVDSNNFEENWYKNEIFNYIRETKTNNTICNSCGFIDICNGGCTGEKIKNYGYDFKNARLCNK
ncbi:radical SAM protein [Peptostreptococcaceae bacterium AGR-M142]